MSSGPEKCPVDHAALAADKCPVDHKAAKEAGTSWSTLFASLPPSAHPNGAPSRLPLDRETSSIPKVDGGNWVYPSQAQFYSAMERKNHNPQATDMKVIVPIHNAVNERAWSEILKWEAGQGGEKCGGVKLVSFKGKPQERTPRARWKMLLGYSPPFDRHDWIVDRCGTRTRYIIDFYTGRAGGPAGNLSFYLDVRPALDSWDGVRLRAERFWKGLIGKPWGSPKGAEPAATRS